jgi:hypothetical protein
MPDLRAGQGRTLMSRDYAAEMRVLIDTEFQAGDSAASVAERIVDKLRATDPTLLAGWLDFQAVQLLREAIGSIDRSTRSHARAQAARGAFGAAADAGDVRPFLSVKYVVDDADTRMPLGEMRREHLVFVAVGYEATAHSALFEAAFFRAVAKKVGSRSVGEVFTSEQIERFRSSLTGRV